MHVPSDVLEERRHLPFQVLDASAIEGIRGLVGESSSFYSCIQICKALTPPPCPPPQRIVARQRDLGPHPTWDPPRSDPAQISGRALSRPCPQVRLWGVGRPPPPDGCTCRVKPRLKSPPPTSRQTGCHAPVLRGAPLTVCPMCCPAPPCRIAVHLCLPCPPTRGGGGGCTAPGGKGGPPCP